MAYITKNLYNTIPEADKLVSTYLKEGFKIRKDKQTDILDDLVMNGKFIHQDKEVTLNGIFKDTQNAWVTRIYNLEYTYSKLKFPNMNIINIKNDDPKDSDKIKEIKASLNEAMIGKMITILNLLKTPKENYTTGYIYQYHHTIFTDILKFRLSNSKNITTFKNDITAFVYFFKNVSKEDTTINNQYKIYKALESDLNFHLGSTKADNVLTDNDKTKYVKYSTLLKVLNTLKINMDELFLKIGTDNIMYKRVHMQYILLSLTLLSPTLRDEYLKMRITDKLADTTNKKYDYLYIPPTGNVKYIFNLVIKGHTTEPYELGILNNQKINYTGEQLSDIIRASYLIFPRKYLFEKFDNKPYAETGFKNLLLDILENKSLGINALRSSFGTFITNSDKSHNVQLDSAYKMRSSLEMLNKNYRRIDDEEEAGAKEPIIQIITKPKPPTDRQAVMLNYYTNNKKELLDKQKAKYANDLVYQQAIKAIAYLNNRQGSTPKDESKIKHKLYEQNGRWYSEIVEDRKKAKALKD
jgi:hypothetical protein